MKIIRLLKYNKNKWINKKKYKINKILKKK